MALRWGVLPLHCEVQESADTMLAQMEAQLLSRGLVQSGDTVLVVGSMPLRAGVRTNFLKVHPIGKQRLTARASLRAAEPYWGSPLTGSRRCAPASQR